MAIQHRRGADVDFKAEKMLPGEIAVTIDGTRKVYAAFAPGDVKELASKEEVQNIVDNFENSVDEKIDEAVQQVTDEATEQVEGIVAKGEEILNSIPVDYQETVKEVTQLKEDLAKTTQSKADAIICEAEGTTIVATDSSDAGFEELHLYGKSKQGSTTGAQLWNGNYISNVFNENDILTDVFCYAGNKALPIKAGHQYTFSVNGVLTPMRYVFVDENNVGIGSLVNGVTTTVAPTNAVYLCWRSLNGIKESDKCMLNAGTEPIPWEPYTGGKPSPNPEYPQEVVSVGDSGSVEGKVCGAQLYDSSFRETNGNIACYNGTVTEKDGVYTIVVEKADCRVWDVSYTGEGYKDNRGPLIEIPEGVTQFYVTLSNTSFIKNFIMVWDSDKNALGYISRTTSSFKVDLSDWSTAKYISLRFGLGDVIASGTYETTVMINAGSEPLPWEPYKEQTLTIQTPNGLPGMPLGTTIPDVIKNSPIHMSGVYWDNKEGQYYIADTVDVEKGVCVKRVTREVFDGSESGGDGHGWLYDSNDGRNYAYLKLNNAIYPSANVMCNAYTNNGTASISDTNIYISSSGYLVICDSSFSDPDAGVAGTNWKAHLAENNITVYYPLATPIETPLSDEEIAAYKALHTNKPTTTIMNSENVYMKVKYVADTENHIKQNYIPLSKYTALEERVAAIEELVIS